MWLGELTVPIGPYLLTGTLSAVFSTFTQIRTRLKLEKVWLEFESSGINLSVSGVQVSYSQHSLDHHSLN